MKIYLHKTKQLVLLTPGLRDAGSNPGGVRRFPVLKPAKSRVKLTMTDKNRAADTSASYSPPHIIT